MRNVLLIASLSAAAVPSVMHGASKDQRPNIIYIMLDDMPYDMLPGGERYPFIDLPNLAQMQKEGVTFTNFFCVHSLSAPSRAANLTGTYPHVNGQTQNISFLDPDWEKCPPFSRYMQSAGYNTAFIGKIHMASDPAHRGKGNIRPGFDYWVSFYGQGAYENPLIVDNGEEIQTKGYMTDILNRYALDWLSSGRNKNKPFAMCLWHKAVHQPFTPAKRHASLYQGETIGPPFYRTDLDDLSTKPIWQRIRRSKDENNPPLSCPPKEWKPRPGQWGMARSLSAVDDSLGDIIELLKKQGILDNTVIMFSSDNGFLMGEHQFGDKRIAYENSIRIPMVIRYPAAFGKGSKIDSYCLNIDVAPTILSVAGIAVPSQMQGESMKTLLETGKDPSWRRSFFYEYFVDDGLKDRTAVDVTCVRTERYKYVANQFYFKKKKDIDELYDLQKDPGEMVNLISDPSYAGVLAELKKELETLKTKYKYNPDRYWRVNQLKES